MVWEKKVREFLGFFINLWLICRPLVECNMCSNVTQIDVIDGGNMNVDLFVEKYAYSGKPLLVKNATNNWKAMTTVRIMSFRQGVE